MNNKNGRFKIFITITFLFTSLLIIFGLSFRQFVFWKSSEMILASSKQYFKQIHQELTQDFTLARETVSQTLYIIGQSPVMSANTLEERLSYLPIFYAALQAEPNLSALQVGYDTGDYFIVRPLSNDFMRDRFEAPAASIAMVDHISKINNQKYLLRIFYDTNLTEIKRNNPVSNNYDPRIRPWYKDAKNTNTEVTSIPYLFHFIQQMGLTISYHPTNAPSVVGGDVTLYHLSETIAKHSVSPRSELAVIEEHDGTFLITAYKDPDKLFISKQHQKNRAQIQDLESDVFSYASKDDNFLTPFYEINFNGEDWIGATIPLQTRQSIETYFCVISPESEILLESRQLREEIIKITGLMLLLGIPVIWVLARRISLPLQMLAKDTKRITRFEFGEPHDFKGSKIKEVHDLGTAMSAMEWTIEQFISLTKNLANEQNFDKLLQIISQETRKLGEGDAVFTYIVDDSSKALTPGFLEVKGQEKCNKDMLPTHKLDETAPIIKLLQNGRRSLVKWQELFPAMEHPAGTHLNDSTIIVFPLWTRNNEGIGLLCLLYDQHKNIAEIESGGLLSLLDTFSGFAAVTLESRKMLKMQKNLLESFIKLIAGAIDSKSPYTGGHCQRVPELTKLLARKACDSNDEPFSEFDLSDDEWEALHIASWLHDCGKVTTPEYVVDKATKLETIYDRIHEVRMRFEVLKREAHIEYFEKLNEGENPEELKEILEKEWKQLDEDFNFIAECNIGGEFMADEKVERLHEIAKRTWTKTISDRIGIAWEESQRKEKRPEQPLPTKENVLADLPEHIIERDEKDRIAQDNPHGFVIETPEHGFNRGELYNLAIARGTLSNEDRYKINDHIVQTIVMLKKLPFPKHLEMVPDIAGSHHEKIDGSGYPRALTGDQMSLTAKMMVIADIFEALTASDRPYKKAKKLSDCVKIMGFMEKDKHIDSDLFKLFLSSGAYLEYAKEHLKDEQIDDVDIAPYISS